MSNGSGVNRVSSSQEGPVRGVSVAPGARVLSTGSGGSVSLIPVGTGVGAGVSEALGACVLHGESGAGVGGGTGVSVGAGPEFGTRVVIGAGVLGNASLLSGDKVLRTGAAEVIGSGVDIGAGVLGNVSLKARDKVLRTGAADDIGTGVLPGARIVSANIAANVTCGNRRTEVGEVGAGDNVGPGAVVPPIGSTGEGAKVTSPAEGVGVVTGSISNRAKNACESNEYPGVVESVTSGARVSVAGGVGAGVDIRVGTAVNTMTGPWLSVVEVGGSEGIGATMMSTLVCRGRPVIIETATEEICDSCAFCVGTDNRFRIAASTARGEFPSTVRVRVRLVGRLVGSVAGEISESASDNSPSLGETVNDVPVFSITRKHSCPPTVSFLLETAVQPATITKALCSNARVASLTDTASADAACPRKKETQGGM